MCDEALTCIRPHEQGQLVAVGSKNGSVYMLEFSESLTVNQKNDKILLTAVSYFRSILYIICSMSDLCADWMNSSWIERPVARR